MESAASQSFLSFIMETPDDSMQERLDQSLSLNDLTKALEFLEKNKTLRRDGLLAELYSALWDLFGQDLLEVCHSMLLAGTMSESMRKGIITLIYKRKGEREKIRNWMIPENLVLLRHMIAYVQDRRVDVCVISLDQEKAFDRILHTYMWDDRLPEGAGNKVWRGRACSKSWEERIVKLRQKLGFWEHLSSPMQIETQYE
eukprot:g40784.t1